MKTMLVGTDFSPAAFNAACYAVDMALAMQMEVLLLNIYTIPISYAEVPVPIDEEQIVDDITQELNKLKERLVGRTKGKVTVKTTVRVGMFFTELDIICKQIKPYAVVLGSQGSTAAERLFFGGHTVYAMKHLTWPLIVVPPEVHFKGIKRLGLACDFEEVAETVPFSKIKALIQDFHAELHILNIAKQWLAKPEKVAQLDVLQGMLQFASPHYHYAVRKDTDQSIADVAKANLIDLLIVLPKHHDLLHLLTHRSHTRQLVMHCHIPLMALQ